MLIRRGLLAAAAGIILIAITSSCKKSSGENTDQKGGQRPPTAVQVYIARTQNITSVVNASGTLLSNEEVEIKPELQARVIKVYFTEGEKVNKGKLLVKLDDADILAQLKKLRAQKKLTQKNVDRLTELLKIDGVSKQEYDAAQTQLTAYDADIEALETQLAKTEIRAPFSGTIGLSDISEGAYVTPLSTIATLQQTHPLKVDFSIPEKYASLLQTGKILSYTVDGFRDTFEAQVYAIDPKIDLNTRNIKVRARTPNPNGKLLPGMFANVSLGIQSRANAVMVPTQALVPVARGKQIILVKNGKAAYLPVQAGLRDANLVEIVEGLQAGDTVVTTGLMQLRPNADVKILKVD